MSGDIFGLFAFAVFAYFVFRVAIRKSRKSGTWKTDAERAGLEGERMAMGMVQANGCAAIHDLYLPYRSGRGHAQIDILALTARGIAVIEVKRWAGTITVDPVEKWIVSNRGRIEARHNPIQQNALHAKALSEHFPGARFHNVVLLLGSNSVNRQIPAELSVERLPDWIAHGFVDKATYRAWKSLEKMAFEQDRSQISKDHIKRVQSKAA